MVFSDEFDTVGSAYSLSPLWLPTAGRYNNLCLKTVTETRPLASPTHLRPSDAPSASPSPPPTPVISVVMPTFNGERFLRPAIESILAQTFAAFELIVIDDGSTDATPQILASFHDPRIVLLANPRNLGIAASTNRGLAAARGEFIALHDHDDISLPHRFQTQLDFLNSHPDIALVGSAATLIDDNSIPYAEYREPEDDIELKWEALFRCPISHTSVMVRRRVMLETGGYSLDPVLKVASDYDLLSRIVMHYRVANLSQPLVRWRRHAEASMITDEPQLRRGIENVSLRNLHSLQNGASYLDADWNYRCLGSRAFLCTPTGQGSNLPPEQVISGLLLLCALQGIFFRQYAPLRPASARLSRRLNWTWGKHAVALSARSPWDLRSRIRMLLLGTCCLWRVVRTGRRAPGAGMS